VTHDDEFKRACWGGPCTDLGKAEPGFCQCKADRQRIAELEAVVSDTLKAVLYHFGPEGAATVTQQVIELRKARSIT